MPPRNRLESSYKMSKKIYYDGQNTARRSTTTNATGHWNARGPRPSKRHQHWCRKPSHVQREEVEKTIIGASVKLEDTLAMLIWRETFNGILCCFGGNTDKWYTCSRPISMVKLNSYFFMKRCIISEYITQKMYQLRYEIVHSVTEL